MEPPFISALVTANLYYKIMNYEIFKNMFIFYPVFTFAFFKCSKYLKRCNVIFNLHVDSIYQIADKGRLHHVQ